VSLGRVPRRLVLSALGAGGAALAAGAALWRAFALEPLPAPRPPAATLDRAVTAPGAVYTAERVLAAVEKDPFHPERRRPALRFRFPAEAVASHRHAAQGPDLSAAVRVIGTAVLADGGGFAICQRSGGSPRLVRLGGMLGDLTLKAVEPGQATFVTPGGATLVVRVLKPGGGS